jgi:hypothetical protein
VSVLPALHFSSIDSGAKIYFVLLIVPKIWDDTIEMGERELGSIVVKAVCLKPEGRGFDT